MRRRRLAGAPLAAGAIALVTGLTLSAARTPRAPHVPERHPQTAWAACNRHARNPGARRSTFRPLSDAAAAALVTPEPEDRRDNARPFTVKGRRHAAANDDVPTTAQLRRFRRARTSAGQPITRFNPYFAYVDGRDGLRHPSTDDLIQWVAHKWGIPEDWLRAEYVQESYWNQFQLGDRTRVSAGWYRRYPAPARLARSADVYQSMGIAQVKWIPNGAVGAGTEPLRWQSTAFNLDYQAAMVRFYFDNPDGARSAWGDRSYGPCQRWSSVGGWFEPYPWDNPGQQYYIRNVRRHLAGRDWTSADFAAWRPPSLPPGIRIR